MSAIVFFTALTNGLETPTSDSWMFGEGGLRTGLCVFTAGPGKKSKDGDLRYATNLVFKGGEFDGQANGTDSFQVYLPEKESDRATAVARAKTFVMSCTGAVKDFIAKIEAKKGKWTVGFDAETGDLHFKWQTDKTGVKVFKAAEVTGYCYVHGAPPREEWPTVVDPKTREVKVETQYAQVDYITSDKHPAVENGTFRPSPPRAKAKAGAAQANVNEVNSVRSQVADRANVAERQVARQDAPSDDDVAPSFTPSATARIPAAAGRQGPPARPTPAPVAPVSPADESIDEP